MEEAMLFKNLKIENNPNPNKKVNKDLGVAFNIFTENNLLSFFALSADQTIAYVNKSMADMLGYSEQELINKKIDHILLPDSQIDLDTIFNSKQSDTIILYPSFVTKSQTVVYAHVTGIHSSFGNENEEVLLFIFTDISEKIQKAENLKIQNQNLRLKDELIISKDIELRKQNTELIRLNKELTNDRKNLEDLQKIIIENEMRLKLAFNAVNDGIWDWNLQTNEFYFSDRFFTMLGYEPFEFPNTLETLQFLIHTEDTQKVMDQLLQVSKGVLSEFTAEFKMRTRGNNYIWVLSRGKVVETDAKGNPSRMMGTHMAISELKEIELMLKNNDNSLKKQNDDLALMNKQLSDSNQNITKINKKLNEKQALLNSIFKSVPALIGLIAKREIVFVNEYAALMTGYNIEELIGQSTSFLYPSIEEYNRVEEMLYYENSIGNSNSVTTVWKMKNGTLIDVYITASPIASSKNENTYSFSALDITNQRLYEEELVHAKDQAEKAERLKIVFLSNISHELRTPMNGIIGFTELLQSQTNTNKRDQYLKVISNSAKQLLRIVTDIVDISKIETSEVDIFETEVSLNKLFQEFHETYSSHLIHRNKPNIELQFENCFPEQAYIINTDETKIRQILNNLLGNAAKFTETGTIQFGCCIKNDFIEFYVKDTGIGVPPEEFELIFECFRQTDHPTRKLYGGTGLGLAISKGFLMKLGGRIWVESEQNIGSTFFFTIPYKPIPQEMDANSDAEIKIWSNYEILVVEDEIMCFELVVEMLSDTGLNITHASTGLEALKICRKNNNLKLVLMDMRLPEIDGYEATKRIKEFKPNLPIIAQTAHALLEDRSKCINAGCDDYMTKPLNQELLIAKIKYYIDKE
jgi:PAS domain S-box-containing protein